MAATSQLGSTRNVAGREALATRNPPRAESGNSATTDPRGRRTIDILESIVRTRLVQRDAEIKSCSMIPGQR
ncbi:MAG: hypothetical protein OES09_11400, partial [Gammaproteobacteria bacterium]|nr:hypothetical protein [Gammaproteobacteria bacterium]